MKKFLILISLTIICSTLFGQRYSKISPLEKQEIVEEVEIQKGIDAIYLNQVIDSSKYELTQVGNYYYFFKNTTVAFLNENMVVYSITKTYDDNITAYVNLVESYTLSYGKPGVSTGNSVIWVQGKYNLIVDRASAKRTLLTITYIEDD